MCSYSLQQTHSDPFIMTQYIPVLMRIEIKWVGMGPNALHRYMWAAKANQCSGRTIDPLWINIPRRNSGTDWVMLWKSPSIVNHQMAPSSIFTSVYLPTVKPLFQVNFTVVFCSWCENVEPSSVSSDVIPFSHLLLLPPYKNIITFKGRSAHFSSAVNLENPANETNREC